MASTLLRVKKTLPKGIGEMSNKPAPQRAAESKDSAASLRAYLAEIGAKGGKASRRKITPEQQAAMQKARKAKRRTQGTNDETQDAAK